MAGDWLKFEKSTLEKPEVFEIAGILGLDPDAVIGKLLRVWNWFDDQSRDGNAPVTVTALLDRYAGVTGFVEAMGKVGWIKTENDRLILPNFERHNGSPAKSRALGKARQQSFRKSNGESNAESVTGNVTTALPEKRREEKKKKKARGTEKELSDYCQSIGLPASDGEIQFDKWEGNGWMNGTSPIKDWQATIRAWKKQGFMPSQRNKPVEQPGITSRGW